ncbi:MAG: peptidoglycan-binding protein [Clostridia bacterium]|nr:peptidoglycan-binding protein [Clostridia bacterium]
MKRIAAMLVLIALLLLPCAHASNNYSVLTNCDIMRRGSRGDNVRRIQQALINMGYLSGNADGSYGSKTEAAVRDFQW